MESIISNYISLPIFRFLLLRLSILFTKAYLVKQKCFGFRLWIKNERCFALFLPGQHCSSDIVHVRGFVTFDEKYGRRWLFHETSRRWKSRWRFRRRGRSQNLSFEKTCTIKLNHFINETSLNHSLEIVWLFVTMVL